MIKFKSTQRFACNSLLFMEATQCECLISWERGNFVNCWDPIAA